MADKEFSAPRFPCRKAAIPAGRGNDPEVEKFDGRYRSVLCAAVVRIVLQERFVVLVAVENTNDGNLFGVRGEGVTARFLSFVMRRPGRTSSRRDVR